MRRFTFNAAVFDADTAAFALSDKKHALVRCHGFVTSGGFFRKSDTQSQVAHLVERHSVSLYHLYLFAQFHAFEQVPTHDV